MSERKRRAPSRSRSSRKSSEKRQKILRNSQSVNLRECQHDFAVDDGKVKGGACSVRGVPWSRDDQIFRLFELRGYFGPWSVQVVLDLFLSGGLRVLMGFKSFRVFAVFRFFLAG